MDDSRNLTTRVTRVALALVVLGAILTAGLSAASRGPGQTADAGDVKEKKLSYFTRLWELDKGARKGKRGVTYHRSNYALALSYNSSPNLAPLQEADPTKTLTKPEVTFQLSFKAKLWEDFLGREMDLWLGYTQRSFWQLYNFDDSSPFRETNYEPEVLLNFRTRFSFLGLQIPFVTVGLNHQSNGQSEPLSRSWNRIVAHLGLERGEFSLLLSGWFRIPESAVDNDNPRIDRYIGYGEVRAFYFLKKHRLGVMLRNNLNFVTNRGALQIEWSFPLLAQFSGYVQYYIGYGESLLDYNHRVNRIGIGFILSDWN